MRESIAALTVAAALRDEDVLAQLCEMTGLTPRKLANRLGAVHGRTGLRQALAEELPLVFEKLALLTVKQARTWALGPEIARVWNLSEERVAGILASVHGRTSLWRAFDPDLVKEEPHEEVELDDQADAEQAEGDEDDGDAEGADGEDDSSTDLVAALKLDSDGTWSRPRQVARLLRIMGLPVPRRLRTSAFQRMISDLAALGVEARLEDDEAPLPAWATSPGIGARVRLRICEGPSEDEVDHPEQEEDAPGESEPDADVPDDSDDADNDGDADIVAALKLDPDGTWSRPRQLARMLRILGLAVPQRLRKTAFQTMILRLANLGVQARLEDEGEPLPIWAPSPGINARVCLRLCEAPAEPSTFPQGRMPPTARPPPIVVVQRPVSVTTAVSPYAGSDWELALLRLQFLTAVPSIGRQHDPEWPMGFLAAAMEDLKLTEAEARHLQTVSASLARGNHNPFALFGDLINSAGHHNLNSLFDHFVRLNRQLPEVAADLVRQVREKRVFSPRGWRR